MISKYINSLVVITSYLACSFMNFTLLSQEVRSFSFDSKITIPKSFDPILDRVKNVGQDVMNGNVASLLKSFSTNENIGGLDMVFVQTDNICSVSLMFFEKTNVGMRNFTTADIGFNKNEKCVGYTELNDLYGIHIELANDNNIAHNLLDISTIEILSGSKESIIQQCKCQWTNNGMIEIQGDESIASKIEPLQKNNNLTNNFTNVVLIPPTTFKRKIEEIMGYINTLKSDMFSLTPSKAEKLPLLNKNNDGVIRRVTYDVNKKQRFLCIVSSNTSMTGNRGYAMLTTDEYPVIYYEGDIDFNDTFSIVEGKFYFEKKLVPLYGNGTEVKFHPTGYPASYKTIVKNRLFGRQIEWNDKGEVISDVDLDIPKPWADAPKKDEDRGQKK